MAWVGLGKGAKPWEKGCADSRITGRVVHRQPLLGLPLHQAVPDGLTPLPARSKTGDSARPRPSFSPYGSVASVNVPDFMGAGAVSVNVLDVVVFSPSRARPVPEAEIQVAPPEVRTFPVTVAPPFWE